jgi:hypothetical protein
VLYIRCTTPRTPSLEDRSKISVERSRATIPFQTHRCLEAPLACIMTGATLSWSFCATDSSDMYPIFKGIGEYLIPTFRYVTYFCYCAGLVRHDLRISRLRLITVFMQPVAVSLGHFVLVFRCWRCVTRAALQPAYGLQLKLLRERCRSIHPAR